MDVFGKKKITESEAAGKFVITIARSAQEYWPSIAKELNQLVQSNKAISEDQYASFEFGLAVIATQIQALSNLLKQEQANRIRKYILECVSSPELGSYPRETIEEYQTVWDSSLEQGEPPYYGIASVLFDKLECEDTVELGGDNFKSPILLMALSEQVVKFGGPWWQNVIEKYKIVP